MIYSEMMIDILLQFLSVNRMICCLVSIVLHALDNYLLMTQRDQRDVVLQDCSKLRVCFSSGLAKANSQDRCENFHSITTFKSTCCELAS